MTRGDLDAVARSVLGETTPRAGTRYQELADKARKLCGCKSCGKGDLRRAPTTCLAAALLQDLLRYP